MRVTQQLPELVISPPPPVTLPVAGERGRFPVNRVFCVGRNYAEHAREMGHDPERERPFFFMKPASAVVADGAPVPYPQRTAELHHEVELVVAMAAGGEGWTPEAAQACVFGYAVGVDLTRRDLQRAAKSAGRPWESAKAFDASAPCGALARGSHPPSAEAEIRLDVDGKLRQRGRIGQLIWSVPEILAELSALFCIAPGDLVFTGTPAGVGVLAPGARLRGQVTGLPTLEAAIAPRS